MDQTQIPIQNTSSSSSSSSTPKWANSNEEEEEFTRAMLFATSSSLPMTLRAAIELDLFEILARAPSGSLSATEIVSLLPARNPDAPKVLERLLRFLASFSVLTCSLVADENDGRANKRVYGLTPVCKYFVRNQDGVSVAPLLLLLQDKALIDSWYHVKDAILEGEIPFNKVHGMHAFEYPSKDSRFNEVFNQGMHNITTISMKKILEVYKGFESLSELVDVGGGSGAMLSTLLSKYPHIKAINYDLPHVIKHAPPFPGLEHVGGDMFESVPKGEAIFMKYILHDWSDDHCAKLLRNCWNALPESGKLIVVESLLPEHPAAADDSQSRGVFCSDMIMLTVNPGGKERTKNEYDALAMGAGFGASELKCQVYGMWVFEFQKL